jgi:hypothetical protein
MRVRGGALEGLGGLEVGNAWTLRPAEALHTNWVVGDHPAIPEASLRFLRHGGHPEGAQVVEGLALKWFAHSPADPPEWGEGKPLSTGRTVSLLAGAGAFELWFARRGEAGGSDGSAEVSVLLEEPGDFALWGPGLTHRWRVWQPSLVVTLRWELVERGGG